MSANTGALPRKLDGLHAREAGGEIVVVNELTKEAHVLRGLTAELWLGIDAGQWPTARKDELAAAADELRVAGLVETDGMSRRTLLRHAGTAAVAGTIVTIALPQIAAAASLPVPTLTFSAPTTKKNTGYTLTVTVAGGSSVPTGSVQLTPDALSGATVTNNTQHPDPAPLDSSGVATFLVSNPNSVGTSVTFTAVYSGDTSHAPNTNSLTYQTTQ